MGAGLGLALPGFNRMTRRAFLRLLLLACAALFAPRLSAGAQDDGPTEDAGATGKPPPKSDPVCMPLAALPFGLPFSLADATVPTLSKRNGC